MRGARRAHGSLWGLPTGLASLGCALLLCLLIVPEAASPQFSLLARRNNQKQGRSPSPGFLIPPAAAPLIAGSVGGAVGVFVAYPFDTLKTKAQISRPMETDLTPEALPSPTPTDAGALVSVPAGRGRRSVASLGRRATLSPPSPSMLETVRRVLETEGFAGFYKGVRAMVLGQAIIKAVAFASNDFALQQWNACVDPAMSLSAFGLLVAAMFAGLVTSFVVAPFERIKVMLQSLSEGGKETEKETDGFSYSDELSAWRAVILAEGWKGLMLRGLGPTIAREVPSYGIYFVAYSLFMSPQTGATDLLGALAPLVGGAAAGCACWLPVYPIDVVKTAQQSTVGGSAEDAKGAIETAREIWDRGGVGAFFDGLTPKLVRAVVNHAVTFFVFDLMLKAMTGT
uniref:Mitochondrial carrier protein n=1 Tax=Chromera velia CCMP2878 TaxID=1169474 RepID=A0A0G4HKR9_9ALVE|mmetsp:Transcript_38242/g.75130  ORF Transcript_38242/g.75130 Transcript_38242/m.75130 type:complete len:399 (+) Transcript_38242:180-1376(+)|eukprot:Cvel_7317.t1-p1 / transcript=Cvel_7317.t1 / gene=Cvel_7317 / organism=Chromera_velia_CCMP2878 / gene_product=Carrier protein YMC1, mitochondrial, putative / transcript_product=Carrier protein YMC1, mitochondrial, putative / location=Cvel_scaffold379:48077-49270(-) / protein_length=398 / sequence_SO=supercontig / SO=protein_coding / is_pseudo=false